nr:aldehyde dehydrogenase family protein [Janthinobacterium sp. GW460W]
MASRSERTSEVFNPATGAVTAKVALATPSELNAAVAAAHAAFPAWSQTSPLRRARVMFKFKELLEQNADRLAELITREHGKVFTDAKGEVTRGIEVVEFACGIPQMMKGEYSEQVAGGIDAWSIRQALGAWALGACVGITPFRHVQIQGVAGAKRRQAGRADHA